MPNYELSKSQILNILSETTREIGSDDLAVLENFLYTDSSITSIKTIRPVCTEKERTIIDVELGEKIEIIEKTNINPNNTTITVEIISTDAKYFDIKSTNNWNGDGIWRVTQEIPENIMPARYEVIAINGDSLDV